MSHFLRQLHVFSSLKTSSDRDKILPLYKTILPLISFDESGRQMHTQVLSKNLQLRTPKASTDAKAGQGKRNLAIILSWLLAKGSHIEKYCNLYMSRGFDVLTVSLTPNQMLFPTTGTQVVATNILNYIDSNKQYEKILVHAFSIGGYLMGEVFVKYNESRDRYHDFPSRVAGIVLDSAVDFEGIVEGFPRAVAKNPIAVRCLEMYMKSHLAFMYNIATKHYLNSSKNFHNTPLNCPALFLVSEADKVGTPSSNQRLANDWKDKGIDVSFKCFEKSGHVSHMHHYKDEYVGEINKFLSKLDVSAP